jgi:dethiobiotin synthetase
MKPVASGCAPTAEGLRNDDALLLQAAASQPVAYERINRYAFEPAIAPHLAAARAQVTIALELIARDAEALAAGCDCVVVEGVGGWLVPLGPEQTVGDLARCLGLPVIMVVGMRLGCINHALLTAAAIEASGLPLAGWVANLIDPKMEAVADNARELALRLRAPLLGIVPHMHGHPPSQVAGILDISSLT